ncbi:hypothetical protein K491DRAFT_711870 [Lophiostoma macrostomum CBS 122681]|uniref:F-box domain-containing protein n=1 Tax=Lophiostoma macrostomum CBS 122681 TaxID=1314788 RepID=A0A6A6TK24_9PLEO|nr:hypothetical protein K491DRAFT_711870 [Lophiostoma macrostomum CBS 122681]
MRKVRRTGIGTTIASHNLSSLAYNYTGAGNSHITPMEQTSSTSKGPSPLESIPTELLLLITTFLTGKDLKALARTNRNISTAAEGTLYRVPRLLEESNESSLFRLYRTLADYPQRASMVKDLEIRTFSDYVKSDTSMLDTQSPMPEIPIHIFQPGLMGRILLLLNNLEKLVLIPYNRYATPCFEDLFRSSGLSPGSIPAFRNLQSLSLGWESLPWSVACIPRLDELTIPAQCGVAFTDPEDGCSTAIKTLKLRALECILLLNSGRFVSLRQLLARCPLLTNASISILNAHKFFDNWTSDMEASKNIRNDPASYSTIRHLMAPTSPTLEALDLGMDDDQSPYFLDCVSRIGSLTDFEKLRTLRLPFEALCGHQTQNSWDTTTILPPSLEHLEIQFPTACTTDFLKSLYRDRSHFPCLKMIILYCSNARGDTYEHFRYGAHGHPAFSTIAALKKKGIFVEYHYRECDRSPCWLDENYDPVVMAIVGFLNSLHDLQSVSTGGPLRSWWENPSPDDGVAEE